MRWYLDTEFYEDGRTIDLISIGLVSERLPGGQHHAYYAVNDCFDRRRIVDNKWLHENVMERLYVSDPLLPIHRPPIAISRDILDLINSTGEKPEFWAYFAAYDWVVLCQLFGTMMQLPDGWPKLCLDIKQEMIRLGLEKRHMPTQPPHLEHNAIEDAIHDRAMHEHVIMYDRMRERR